MKAVKLFYNEVSFYLPGKTRLKQFIPAIFRAETKRPLKELSYIFCTDAYLLEVNRQFLQHDDYTDIITFDLSEPGNGITGEIYISIDRVRDNAQEHNTSMKQELHRVIFHGALHLCGYKDKKPAEIKQMRNKEDHYINQYFATGK